MTVDAIPFIVFEVGFGESGLHATTILDLLLELYSRLGHAWCICKFFISSLVAGVY
jgi:hypothetical protein